MARDTGYALFLTANETVLRFGKAASAEVTQLASTQTHNAATAVLRWCFLGEQSQGCNHRFAGSQPGEQQRRRNGRCGFFDLNLQNSLLVQRVAPGSARCVFAPDADLHVINTDGSGRRLTNTMATEQSPRWSPDGRQLLYIHFTPSRTRAAQTTPFIASTPTAPRRNAW